MQHQNEEARIFLVVKCTYCATCIAELALAPFGYDLSTSHDGSILESVLKELDRWSGEYPVVASQLADLKEVFCPKALRVTHRKLRQQIHNY